MGRKILLITTDQQRWDALGCNGGAVARTPVADRLAAEGIRYERPYCQNTICMPSRATILSGQYPRTHGLIASGIPLPAGTPSVAAELAGAGYRTAIVGKAHFEPAFGGDPRYEENRLVPEGRTGPYQGFEHAELAAHGPLPATHYGNWLALEHPDDIDGFCRPFDPSRTGVTGAPEMTENPVPRDCYHTDWVADRVIAWLDGLDEDEDWFCWMSFPDPHHPWDPPASENHRVPWRDVELSAGYLDPAAAPDVLGDKPAHWMAWWDGSVGNLEGACPPFVVPSQMTADQHREVNAKIHISNELVDEACGRVLDRIEQRGWGEDTDVVYTSDHGEFQGDFGLLYKGPYHVDALMRVPLLWRPAPSVGVAPAVVSDPVGLVDVAPTLCAIAGLDIPEVMQGTPLPTSPEEVRERALCEWDSTLTTGYRLRSIVRDGWLCTAYERTRPDWGLPREVPYQMFGHDVPPAIEYDGTEGELYDLEADPHQHHNRWDDRAVASLRSDLVTDLYDSLPAPRQDQPVPEAIA